MSAPDVRNHFFRAETVTSELLGMSRHSPHPVISARRSARREALDALGDLKAHVELLGHDRGVGVFPEWLSAYRKFSDRSRDALGVLDAHVDVFMENAFSPSVSGVEPGLEFSDDGEHPVDRSRGDHGLVDAAGGSVVERAPTHRAARRR